MSDLPAKRIKKLFIVVMVLLPLQYAVVGIVGINSSEPWPAFVFPGFKSIYVYGDSYQINEYVIAIQNNENQQIREFTPRQFFYEIPNSQLAGFLRTNLETAQDVNSFDESTRRWFHERGDELLEEGAGEIQFVHRRRYMTRFGDDLRVDSVTVIRRINIAEVMN